MNEQISILIPLGNGSRHDNLELRYCLRSMEKHLQGFGKIWIIGELPNFINPDSVVWIHVKQNPDNKMRANNIYNKIMTGINGNGQTKEILSDNFLFMNDDHFLLTDYEASEFPYYHRGIVQTHRVGNEAQRVQMENTVKRIHGDVYDFGVHCPILYNKERFRFVFTECITNDWPDYGYEIKSLYANSIIDTTAWVPCEDLKFTEKAMKESIYRALESRSWFSIGDKVLSDGSGMKEVLQDLYPNKSQYEI